MATEKFDPRYVDITIDGLRFRARPPHGDEHTDVLEIYHPEQKYSMPWQQYPRHDSYSPMWCLYEAAVGRANVQVANESQGILQPWVAALGLRHQGCLLSAVRGPDNEPKEGSSKRLIRFYRASILRAFVGDPRKATTFMIWVDDVDGFWKLAEPYLQSYDHFHNHFVMHFLHATEICGYKMPEPQGKWWAMFYHRMCRKLHLNIETEAEMDTRLTRSEKDFARQQVAPL